MSNNDSELERLKAKRLAEMQKNISSQHKVDDLSSTSSEKPSTNPRDVLVDKLGYRGLEVLENAEFQFHGWGFICKRYKNNMLID